MKFKDQLKSFKPKQSVLEQNILKSMDVAKINRFQDALNMQNEKYSQKLERKEYEKEVRDKFDIEQKVHDDKVIEMKNKERENDSKLLKKRQMRDRAESTDSK